MYFLQVESDGSGYLGFGDLGFGVGVVPIGWPGVLC